jgi:excisionase family DNA binding protein
MSPEPYITKEDAAAYLGLSPRTLERRVHDRSVPFHKVGPSLRSGVRFRYSELDAWVAEQTSASVA